MSSAPIIVDRLVSSLNAAQNDTERLAALLLVTQCIKAEKTSSDDRRRLFNAIGFRFVNRLLRTKNVVGDEGASSFYRSIALSVLSSFCTDPTLVVDLKMLSNLVLFNEIITLLPGVASTSDETRIVLDCYDCLSLIAADSKGRVAFSAAGTVTALSSAIIQRCYGYQRALKLMSCLARSEDNVRVRMSQCHLEELLKSLVEQFQIDIGEEKFEICNLLTDLISSHCSSDCFVSLSTKDFWKTLNVSLYRLLSNKLSGVLRDSVLRLISNIVKAYGLRWLVLNCRSGATDCGRSFLMLVIQLSCVEIRMTLDDCDVHNIGSDKQDVVASCCVILEDVQNFEDIDTVAVLDGDQLEKIGGALMGAMRSIMSFIQYQHDHETDPRSCPVIFACMRLLGAWSSDEECATSSEFTQLLPAIISVCRSSLHNNIRLSSTQGILLEEMREVPEVIHKVELSVGDIDINPPDNEGASEVNLKGTDSGRRTTTCSLGGDNRNESNAIYDYSTMPELIQFMLPGLAHASSSSVLRGVMSESNIVGLITECFLFKSASFFNVKLEDSACNEDFFVHLCEILQSFLNCENSLLKSQQSSFSRLSQFLCGDIFNDAALTRLADNNLSVLVENVVWLRVILLSKTFINSNTSVENATRILNSAISLLCKTFVRNLPERASEDKAGSLMRQTGDDEAAAFHTSALKGLIDCLPKYPDVFISSVLQSGHLNSTILSLLDVKEPNTVTRELLSGFEEILCAIVSQSSEGRTRLNIYDDVILLVRTFKMNKLSKLVCPTTYQ